MVSVAPDYPVKSPTTAEIACDCSFIYCRMAYSSITSHVHMFNTDNPDEDSHTLLDFSEGGTSRRGRRWFGHDFGVRVF